MGTIAHMNTKKAMLAQMMKFFRFLLDACFKCSRSSCSRSGLFKFTIAISWGSIFPRFHLVGLLLLGVLTSFFNCLLFLNAFSQLTEKNYKIFALV